MAEIDGGNRQTHVVEQMDRLSGNVNALEGTATELIKRLDPLLKPAPPESEDDSSKKAQAERDLVPHAENLRALNRRLNRVNIALNDAISGLEL